MKTISVHGLEEEAQQRIRRLALEKGVSLNQMVKQLLRRSVGLASVTVQEDQRQRFSRFCGLWSEEDAQAFAAATQDHSRIDAEDWQ